MARTVEAILLEAEEWYAIVGNLLELNGKLGSIGDKATSAAVNAIAALTRDNVAGAVEAQSSALGEVLELVVEAQPALLSMVKVAGDRVTTLRVEAAELQAELEP
jgi:hypothetical protein